MTVDPSSPRQHRSVVMAPSGIVATGHPLASSAGLQALMDGGNAIDAAFTAAGVLGVVQPMMSGLGGDSFLLLYERASRRVWAVNGSGPAPQALSLQYLQEHTDGALPMRGILSAGVPGSVDVFCTAVERWGSRSFDLERILQPAIRYAEEGAPVAPLVARSWAIEEPALAKYASSSRALLRDGRAYQAGERFSNPEYAALLRSIASGGRNAFYRGEAAERIAAYCRANGGLIDEDDLGAYHCETIAPISTTYREFTVYSNPPPSQGVIQLEMLNLVEGFDLGQYAWGSAEAIHLMAEAKKLAFADRNAYLADPLFHTNPVSQLLSKEYARRRRAAIDPQRAVPTVPPGGLTETLGDTTYLCAADRDGNMVSLITSLSSAFGCAEVIEGTGMVLNNRVGRGFSTDPASPNVLAPGKRTMHTLLPYLALRDNEPYIAGGTPGGDAQPQINLQVLTNMTEWGMSVQQAIEAPRWSSFPGTDPISLGLPLQLRLEPGFDPRLPAQLERLGHRVIVGGEQTFCGAQVIQRDAASGSYHAGSDPRIDGCAAGY